MGLPSINGIANRMQPLSTEGKRAAAWSLMELRTYF